MNRFKVVSRFKSTIDGAVVDQGAEIGVLETALSQDFILSMIRSGAALVQSEPEAIASQAAIAASPVYVAPTPEPVATPTVNTTAPATPIDDDSDLEPLAGLAPRVAQSLQDAGLVDADAIRDYIASGAKLVDLEGIGRAAVTQITDWLESQV